MEGNLNLTFEILEKNILDKLYTNSFYRGERIKEEAGAHAARMQGADDNKDIICDEINLAIPDVLNVLTVYLGRTTCKTEDVDDGRKHVFSTQAASNFPKELQSSVLQTIEAFLFDKTLEGWILINMPSEFNNLAQRSQEDLNRLKKLLVERKKPVR